MFTAKVGALLPIIKTGTYARIAVVDFAEGNTQILVKILEGESNVTGDADIARTRHLQSRAEQFRTGLAKELGAEVTQVH
jgi:hypothetical protein